MSLILVTGGARAGKSTFAEQLARQLGGDQGICYLATAEPADDEMRTRIAAHRVARPTGWRTIEVPRNLRDALSAIHPQTVQVVLLDCLTLLVSNVLLAQPDFAGVEDVWPSVQAEINDLIRFAAQPAVTTLVVTNEVGLGIVPANRLAAGTHLPRSAGADQPAPGSGSDLRLPCGNWNPTRDQGNATAH
jgi:adenosylcobinamide kinase/adenosylcobinamide-phosphate guanylyltransferase